VTTRRVIRAAIAFLLSVGWKVMPAHAQDLEPKVYAASPTGANFLVASYSWSGGDVLFDPTSVITDVHADVQALAIGLGHTFGVFGKLGRASVTIPVSWADVTGRVGEQAGEVSRNGFADTRFKFSVNLRGNPAMLPREFAKESRRTILGVSLLASAPSGQYANTRLINIGNNRWAFKPEVGLAWPKGRWDVDAYAGVWLFSSNTAYYPGGSIHTQNPLVAIQGHASYTLRPRLWLAADGTWYHGGLTTVNGVDSSLPLDNSRIGLTLSMPVGDRYSLKASYSSGLVVQKGTNFNTVAIAWQVLWLSPRFAYGLKP
jgi:hypothetical protein